MSFLHVLYTRNMLNYKVVQKLYKGWKKEINILVT
jgi:hypothetical protein